jgi:hypothetical protein
MPGSSTIPGVAALLVSDSLCRITGLSLAAGESAVIGLAGDATADIELPAAFKPAEYHADGRTVTLNDSLEVSVHLAGDTAVVAAPVAVLKPVVVREGDPYQITLKNVSADDSDTLDVYVRWHN